MKNSYKGVLENWKLELISELAHRKGFRPDEMDDMLQRVVLVVANFKYDLAKANGATEHTVLTAVIGKQLLRIQRADSRAKKNHLAHCRDCGMRNEDEPVVDEHHMDHERLHELQLDVQIALSRLSAFERAVCDGLMAGKPDTQIAADLGCDRYHVSVVIDTVRELFVDMGLDSI